MKNLKKYHLHRDIINEVASVIMTVRDKVYFYFYFSIFNGVD